MTLLHVPHEAEQQNHAKRLRLLMLEDDEVSAKIQTLMLRKLGYDVEHCSNGEKALILLETGEYDIAILDIIVPGQSGLDIAQSIRQKRLNTYLIAITAHLFVGRTLRNSEEAIAYYVQYGFDDVLLKPFMLRHLERMMERYQTRHAEKGSNDALTNTMRRL